MKRVRLVLLFIFLFPFVISSVQAQSATLEFTQSRIDVYENESFIVEARLTNPDLQDYDWFSLRGEGPDEHNWGMKTVDLSTHSLYTVSWTISLSDWGLYTLYVECGAYFGGVETLTDWMIVYVDTPPEPSTSPLFFLFLIVVVSVCGAAIVMQRRTKKKGHSEIEIVQPSTIDREGYTEPSTSMILCPFCKAKNESRAPKCWNCGAKM